MGNKLLAFVGTAVIAAAALVPASGAGAAKPASGEPLQFGYMDLFTGASATPSIGQAIEAYVDDWNQRGGHDGQPIDVVFEDVGFDPGKQLAAARTFGTDPKILAVLSGGICQVTKPILATFQIPTFAAVDATTCTQDPSFMFTSNGQAPTVPMLQWAIDEGAKHFGVMYPAIPQLRTGFIDPLDDYIALNPELGVDLTVAEVPLVPTGADFDGAVAKLKAAGVTALFASVTPEGAPISIQSGIRNGFGPADGIKWIFGPNIYDPTLLEKIPDLDGTYTLSTAYPWEDTSNKQVKKMNKTIGDAVDIKDGFAESGYQLGALLEKSLDMIKGPVTRDALLTLWASKPFEKFKPAVVPYTVNFTDGLANPSGGMILLAKNGKFETASDFLTIPAKEFIEQ